MQEEGPGQESERRDVGKEKGESGERSEGALEGARYVRGGG